MTSFQVGTYGADKFEVLITVVRDGVSATRHFAVFRSLRDAELAVSGLTYAVNQCNALFSEAA